MGEMHDLFESYGGEDAYIKAMADDEDVLSPSDKRSMERREIRKARIEANGGAHSKQDVAEIRVRQGDTCAYCGVNLEGSGHVDHIIPLSLGGSNGKENIQLACRSCNLVKGSSHPDKLFDDIKSFHLSRFRIDESLIQQNEILARIGVEGVRSALFTRWNKVYTQASSENAAWRAKMRRKLKSAKAISARH
jgi:hypothetical protein